MGRILVLVSIVFLCAGLSACAMTGGPLHIASGQGDLAAMNAAMASGANPDEHTGDMSNVIDGWDVGGWGGPPLQHAAYYCRGDAARLLIEKGANVNARGGIGLTALHRAAYRDCADVVKVLVEKGADLNVRDTTYQLNPLEWSALAGSSLAARVLVEKGADPDASIIRLRATDKERLPKNLNPVTAVQMLSAYAGSTKQAGPSLVAGGIAVGGRPETRSDVDVLPPARAAANKKSYAIVIGIEQYRQKMPSAEYALQDAKVVSEYLVKALGYPEENVITLTNDRALQSDLAKYFEKWLPNNVEQGSSIFVYFSGHGAPNPRTGDAYLVPYDGDPSFIEETGYSLKRMYAALGKLPAKEIVVALDSCFSGAGGRSVLAKGARPIVMSIENPVLLSKNITVLSASAGDQISSTYDEKGHGLFTYFMLKGIKNEDVVNKDGSLDTKSLFDYIKPQVSSVARKKYNNEQTPQLIGAKNK